MTTNEPADVDLSDLLGDAPLTEGPVDFIYPTGFLLDGAGPNGELLRYTSPQEASALSFPLDDIMRLLSLPLPKVIVQRLLHKHDVADSVLRELLDERWLVDIAASDIRNPAALTGLTLLPNVADVSATDDPTELRVTAAVTGTQVVVSAVVVAVLQRSQAGDLPAAVAATSAEIGMDQAKVGAILMEALGDLIIAKVAYLTTTPA